MTCWFVLSGGTVCPVLHSHQPGSPSCPLRLQWRTYSLTWESWRVSFSHLVSCIVLFFFFLLFFLFTYLYGFCADDWLYERSSNVFHLGEPISIEASVRVGHHMPLRVFVSSCVATLESDMHSVPRYVFVENGWALFTAVCPCYM